MQILWNELKKIVTWKILLLLIFVNSVIYFMLIEFDIKHFPNGRPALDSYNIGIEMIEKYGTSFDEEEFLDFKKTYDAQVKVTDLYLQSRKDFMEIGIDSYEKFTTYDWANAPNEVYDLRGNVMHVEMNDLFWDLQERSRLMEYYEMKREYRNTYPTSAQKLRDEQLVAEEKFGVYPETVMRNFQEFIGSVASAILFSVVLVVSPMILNDRLRQILVLQYTSTKGRTLYKTKISAGLIATFIVITALLSIYLSIYSLNNTSMYFPLPVNSFIGNESWYDPTFIQYILLCIAAIYVIGLVFALLAMAFASIVRNTVALIGVQIPFVIGFLLIGLNPLLVYIINLWNSQWLAPTAYGVMIIASLSFVVFLWHRERKRDIIL